MQICLTQNKKSSILSFRSINFTTNETLLPIHNCSLQARLSTQTYLAFASIKSLYLRSLIGPGILLNLLCLFILSRPKLSNKSTTIIFLRVLALFDILSIILKYIRAEINYQSTKNGHKIFLLTPSACKILYVLMNACISITMWTIVLMSLDKAVAVSYPLKSHIWLTNKRAYQISCCTIITLLLVNLSFIKYSGIVHTEKEPKSCTLNTIPITFDVLTASILPIGLITAANIVIVVVLHRTRYAWRMTEDSNKQAADSNFYKTNLSKTLLHRRYSHSLATTRVELILATKRRVNAQITRMLLAVTLSLIILNIPNTIFFVYVNIYDIGKKFKKHPCLDISDGDILLYKYVFYSSVIQDILSDLPHVVNFFLYYLAGKNFRSIFINVFHQFLADFHLIKQKKRRPL
ncbi:unnamed protein product [Rotaria sp. Silwood1]|nr:unnamed protein product [Rotaria sp. Silwood1]CAF3660729.1 unnamed protein product [Rotaria sp. Silwood1]CAF3753491.1 unnamed protein product [Rotaria sp. Silwood1]CAF4701489.1 unnamed protein product [Rotaria sp. Silwood1]